VIGCQTANTTGGHVARQPVDWNVMKVIAFIVACVGVESVLDVLKRRISECNDNVDETSVKLRRDMIGWMRYGRTVNR
jgi:hypothetical protein